MGTSLHAYFAVIHLPCHQLSIPAPDNAGAVFRLALHIVDDL